jgi:hypothetical protein
LITCCMTLHHLNPKMLELQYTTPAAGSTISIS